MLTEKERTVALLSAYQGLPYGLTSQDIDKVRDDALLQAQKEKTRRGIMQILDQHWYSLDFPNDVMHLAIPRRIWQELFEGELKDVS